MLRRAGGIDGCKSSRRDRSLVGQSCGSTSSPNQLTVERRQHLQGANRSGHRFQAVHREDKQAVATFCQAVRH